MRNFYGIIGIILLSGIFGGIINFFLHSDTNYKLGKYGLFKDIIIGIGSSLLVPLFLYMISSNLIINSENINSNLLVFAGLCLLFSISAKSIIENMSNQLLIQLQNKQIYTENLLYKIIESQLEPDVEISSSEMKNLKILNNMDYTKVLNEIGRSKNVFKTLQSIENNIELSNVNSILKYLINQDLVSFIIWKNTKYYFLTLKGKSLYYQSNTLG